MFEIKLSKYIRKSHTLVTYQYFLFAGVMFAFQTSAEGIAMFGAPLIMQSIYAATVEYDAHACFYVASVICTIPIFLTM